MPWLGHAYLSYLYVPFLVLVKLSSSIIVLDIAIRSGAEANLFPERAFRDRVMLLLSLSKAGLFACYCALFSTGWSIWCLCSWDSCSWLLALSSSMTTWLFAVASFLGCLRPSWWLNWFGLPIYLHHVTACQGLFTTKVFFSVAPWFSTEGSSGGVKSIKRKCEEYWDNRSNIIISWWTYLERERVLGGGYIDILKITCCC